jgi:multidrug efflux system outer membrane protein
VWWDVFTDPALGALEEQALAANQDLRQALARVEQARAMARVSRTEFLPSLDLNPVYDHFQRSSSSFGGSGSFTGDVYSLPLDLSYEVDLWGRVRRSFESARAEAAASLAAHRWMLLKITSDVAMHYFRLRQLDAETRILEQTVELRRAAVQLAEQRAAGGVVSALDVARARTEFATAEAELADVRRRRAEFENALAVLCGKPASDFTVAALPLDGAPPQVPAGLPSTLLERRADVAEAERGLAAANAQIGVAQAAFFPVLRLTGSAGYVSAELGDLFKRTSEVWSLGPSLSLPIFAVGRNLANVQAVRAQYDEALAAYRQRVLVAFADVENALANLQHRGAQAQAQAQVVEAARQAATLSNSRYQQGLVNFLEAVDAERSRLQAERAAVQVLSERLLSTVLLIKALGGAWDVEPATATSHPRQ